MLKYLRIAVTVLSLTACVLLIVVWVRSYYSPSRVHVVDRHLTIQSWKGVVEINPQFVSVGARSQLGMLAAFPYWCLLLLFLTLAGLPWVQWSRRFRLRALLIGMTLVAVLLGLIAAAT